jgi:hypothetical protein
MHRVSRQLDSEGPLTEPLEPELEPELEPKSLQHSPDARPQTPVRPAPACERQPRTHAQRQHSQHLWQLTEVNEAGALRSDFERTERRQAGAATSAHAVWICSTIGLARLIARGGLPSPPRPSAAADSRSEAERDFRDGNHHHVPVVNGLSVDVTDAEVSLEELRDRLDRSGSGHWHRCRHDDLRLERTEVRSGAAPEASWSFGSLLFLENHYPLLQKEVETGRILAAGIQTPASHMTEEARWDYRVPLTFKKK